MDLLITLEHRFIATPDGAVWTRDAFSYSYWQRYREEFDTVRPVARVLYQETPSPGWSRADGPDVSFMPIPHYIGPVEYLRRAKDVKRSIRQVLAPSYSVVLRIPSRIAAVAYPILAAQDRPYGVEVVGDSYGVFSPGAVKHPLRPLFRWIFTRQQRAQCIRAAAVAYVTATILQRRYPAGPGAFVSHFAAVDLPENAYVRAAKQPKKGGPFTIIFVGSLAQRYKAPDVLLDAMALCVCSGLDLRLIMIGDGRYRKDLERRANKLDISSRVAFVGSLSSPEAVRAKLDGSDLFVLPSITEGLPSALIEAMARGLPCIGSHVGGIPELLPQEDMVPPRSALALARKMSDVLADPAWRLRMAMRNIERARSYHESLLRPRRIAFLRALKQRTEAWQADRH